MADLIPAPELDIRDPEQFAAEMIGRVSGGIDADRINSQIEERRRLLALLPSLPSMPVCAELTNANPSSPHTVIMEAIAWAEAQLAYRINQLPRRDQIAFANLFGTGLREATKATTTLTFTSDGQNEATIPAGTEVSTVDGAIIFATLDELVIPADETEGSVAAEAAVAGTRLLSPDTLTKISDAIAFVVSVTNEDAVDSGTDAETIDAALQRARNYQRRAMRLVSAQDVEDFIFEEVQGAGIVKVFPFVKQGDFAVRHAGHTSIVVMTPAGNVVSAEVKTAINEGLTQAIGSQFFYVLDPMFVEFDVAASIKVQSIAPQDSIKAAVERNLRDFYAPKKGNLGRPILRAEIISVIEATPGVDRIASEAAGPIVQTPEADLEVDVYKLPKLNNVGLTVVA